MPRLPARHYGSWRRTADDKRGSAARQRRVRLTFVRGARRSLVGFKRAAARVAWRAVLDNARQHLVLHVRC